MRWHIRDINDDRFIDVGPFCKLCFAKVAFTMENVPKNMPTYTRETILEIVDPFDDRYVLKFLFYDDKASTLFLSPCIYMTDVALNGLPILGLQQYKYVGPNQIALLAHGSNFHVPGMHVFKFTVKHRMYIYEISPLDKDKYLIGRHHCSPVIVKKIHDRRYNSI